MAAMEFRMPAPLDLDNIDELYPQWKRFKTSFKIYLTAAGLSQVVETRKAAIFLNCIGQPAQELYYNILQDEKKEKLEEVIELFENYFKPKSNGMAERAVQIAKKMLKKCNDDQTDLRVALLHYRISPVCGTNLSPAQLVMNRNLKTKLPVCYKYLEPKLNENVKAEFTKSQDRNTRYYNLNTKEKTEFFVGQNVMFLKDPSVNKWLSGTVEKKNGLRSYNILDNNGVRYTRTSYHVRPG